MSPLSANVLADVAAGAAAVARWYDRSNARTDRSNSAPTSSPSLPLPLVMLVFVCLSAAAAASLLTVSRAKAVTSPTAHTNTRRMAIGRSDETVMRGEIRGWIGG